MEPDGELSDEEFENLIRQLAREMALSMFNAIDQRMMAFQYEDGKVMDFVIPLN